jgi:hypothetical protein
MTEADNASVFNISDLLCCCDTTPGVGSGTSRPALGSHRQRQARQAHHGHAESRLWRDLKLVRTQEMERPGPDVARSGSYSSAGYLNYSSRSSRRKEKRSRASLLGCFARNTDRNQFELALAVLVVPGCAPSQDRANERTTFCVFLRWLFCQLLGCLVWRGKIFVILSEHASVFRK